MKTNCTRSLSAVALVGCALLGTQPVAQCVPEPPNIISWWAGEDPLGSVSVADIRGPNHGVVQGAVLQVPGMVGSAIGFNGTSSTVRIPHHPSLKPASQITLEGWIQIETVAGGFYEILRKEDGNDRILLSFQPPPFTFAPGPIGLSFPGITGSGSALAFGISTNGIYRELEVGGPTIGVLDNGQFHHVAATYDGSMRRIYIDGLEVQSVADSGAIGTSGTNDAYLGSLDGTSEFFEGAIDEFTLYDRALSTQEIQRIYLAGTQGKCTLMNTDADFISLTNGGTQTMSLDAGLSAANSPYLVLGTASGTAPGTAIDSIPIPLNVDGWFFTSLNGANQFPFGNTLGTLDGSGRAQATFSLPPGLPSALAGITFHHAFILFTNPPLVVNRASNAVPLTLIP